MEEKPLQWKKQEQSEETECDRKKSQTRLTEGLMSKAPKELKKLNIKEII